MSELKLADDKPRSHPYGDAAGSYEVVVRVIKPLVAPGESLEVEFYFSGYGEILQPKLYFFPSASVFDPSKSHIRSGLKASADGILSWGANVTPLPSEGPVLMKLAGLKKAHWSENTSFFDALGDTSLVFSEAHVGGHAPVELRLSTLPAVEPGKYAIDLAFSYYDGQKWRSSSKRIEFAVTSFLERHQRKLAWYGVLASMLGLGLGTLRFFVN